MAQIRAQIGVTTSEYDKEKLQERLAKLAGGVAVIKVGAATETEMKEKKLRIEDALNATRAAVEEGIVAGGGTAYVNAVPAVEKLISEVEGDEKTGVQIIVKALQEPIRQIAANAGIDGSVVLEKIKTSGKVGYGFDAYKEVYCDMISAGIVDGLLQKSHAGSADKHLRLSDPLPFEEMKNKLPQPVSCLQVPFLLHRLPHVPPQFPHQKSAVESGFETVLNRYRPALPLSKQQDLVFCLPTLA